MNIRTTKITCNLQIIFYTIIIYFVHNNNYNYLLPILFEFVLILDVGSIGLVVKLVLILVLGGFSSTNVGFKDAAVAKSFPPPKHKSFFF